MSNTVYEYEFDPYGTNPNNRIIGERHTITAANGSDLSFFIPRKTPFHRRGFVLRNRATGLPLQPGYDYYFGFRFDQMILSGAMQPIYGAIVLNDRSKGFDLECDYNTIGDNFVLDNQKILELLANKQLDPRTAIWSAVVDVPADLPPVPHLHNAGQDLVGMNEVVARLYDIIAAQEAGFNKSMQSLLEHIADHANPHHITLSDLGIDDLGNFVPATKEEAEAGTDAVKYMPAIRVAQYCNANVVPLINAHANRTDNPHGVTKTQVGLALVQNYQIASVIEAQAGVATNRYMNPAMVKAAIDALAPEALVGHTGDTNNPHQTTKAQVGLGSVENYRIASVPEAVAGTSNSLYITPYLLSQALSNGAGQGLAAHLADKTNPHETTKTQVGLGNVENYRVATTQETIAGISNELYVTPFLLAQAMAGSGAGGLAAHLADINNPHQVTRSQVGLGNVQNYGMATPTDIDEGTATDKYVSPSNITTALGNNVEEITVCSDTLLVQEALAGFPAALYSFGATEISSGQNSDWIGYGSAVWSPRNLTPETNVTYTNQDADYTFIAGVPLKTSDTAIKGIVVVTKYDEVNDRGIHGILEISPGKVELVKMTGFSKVSIEQKLLGAIADNSTNVIKVELTAGVVKVTVGSTSVSFNLAPNFVISDTEFSRATGFSTEDSVESIPFYPKSVPGVVAELTDIVNRKSYSFDTDTWAELAEFSNFRVTKGKIYYNRLFDLTSMGLSPGEMITLNRGTKYISNDNVQVHDNYDGVSYSLPGMVDNDLTVAGDISFQVP